MPSKPNQPPQAHLPASQHTHVAKPKRPPQPTPLSPEQSKIRAAIQLKQTWIPLLLTGGIAFPIFGIIPLLADPSSPFGSLRHWLPTTGILLGLLMLSVGILYMLQVRALLSRLEQLTPRPADFYDPADDSAKPDRHTAMKPKP